MSTSSPTRTERRRLVCATAPYSSAEPILYVTLGFKRQKALEYVNRIVVSLLQLISDERRRTPMKSTVCSRIYVNF